MNIVNKLTIRHLRQNKGRTMITIMGIMLSVAMVCCVAGFVMSVRDMLMRTLIENGKDYHIAYYGVTPQTAEQIAAEAVFSEHYTKAEDGMERVTLYVRFANPDRNYLEIGSEISEKYEMQGMSTNAELLALEGVIAQDNVLMMFIWVAAIAIVIIVVGSVIVIANAFYISSSERVRQFGLLKSMGATKSQIGRSILFEAFVLAVIAIPLGIALGFLIQAVVLLLTNGLLVELSAMNNGDFSFHVVFHPLIIAVSVAVAAVTLLISAWLPARRAANTSPIDAIRQTKDIRIRHGQLKTSRLTGKIFGFEGTLASKSLKRSRGKYRATVVSLTVSIVLFVSVSSLVWMLNKGVEMEYSGYDFDVLITVNGDLDTQDEAYHLVSAIPDAEVKKIQRMVLEAIVPEGFNTELARETQTSANEYGLLLYPIPDAEFAKIAPDAKGDIVGILINTTGAFHEDGKIKEYTPYDCDPGTELTFGHLEGMDEPEIIGSISIVSVMKEIHNSIPATLFDGRLINILIPETTYREIYRLRENGDDSGSFFTVIASDPAKLCDIAEELLLPLGENVSVWDVSQMTRMNRNLVLVIMLFGYGFIAMLSLIAVTSVISTISTSMALRKQEFAMLYSAGMTSGGMNKMLNLESLLYGVKSLVIGLPIGVGLSYLIYTATRGTMEFAYEFPLAAILISAAAVMLLTFGTMRYSKRKLRGMSIVEALRSEVA